MRMGLRRWEYSLWGDSVITANYDNYKRHRRIVAPGFTPKTWDVLLYHWFQGSYPPPQVWPCMGWNYESVPRDDGLRGLELTEILLCGFCKPVYVQSESNLQEFVLWMIIIAKCSLHLLSSHAVDSALHFLGTTRLKVVKPKCHLIKHCLLYVEMLFSDWSPRIGCIGFLSNRQEDSSCFDILNG